MTLKSCLPPSRLLITQEKKKFFSHISHCYLNSIPKRHSFLPSFYTSPLFYVKQELLYRIRKSEEEREKRIIHCGEALPRGSGIDPRLRLSHAPSTNLADGLQPLAVFIVAGQQEAPVAAGPPPPAQKCKHFSTEYTQRTRVSSAGRQTICVPPGSREHPSMASTNMGDRPYF